MFDPSNPLGELSPPDFRWEAFSGGALQVPPASHVLDHLVRAYVGDSLDNELWWEMQGCAALGTVAVRSELAECELCARRGVAAQARYDSKMPKQSGCWGYLCPSCYADHGAGVLGNGLGQYLLGWDEVGPELRVAFRVAKQHWRSRGAEVPEHDPWD